MGTVSSGAANNCFKSNTMIIGSPLNKGSNVNFHNNTFPPSLNTNTDELKELDKYIKSVKLNKPSSRIPRNKSAHIEKATCLRIKSKIGSSINNNSLQKLSEIVILSQVENEPSKYSSVSCYFSIFSSFQSIFSFNNLNEASNQLDKKVEDMCLIMDDQLNLDVTLEIYVKCRELKSKITLINQFVKTYINDNDNNCNIEKTPELVRYNQKNNEQSFTEKDLMVEINRDETQPKKTVSSFKKRQVEFKESLPTKAFQLNMHSLSENEVQNKVQGKIESGAANVVGQAKSSNTKLTNYSDIGKNHQGDLSLIIEAHEDKRHSLSKNQISQIKDNKRLKASNDLIEKVQKPSVKLVKSSVKRVFDNKESESIKNMKYVITLDLKDFIVSKESRGELNTNKICALKKKLTKEKDMANFESLKNCSPLSKADQENSAELSYFARLPHKNITGMKQVSFKHLAIKGDSKVADQTGKEQHLKCFDKSSLYQPLEKSSNRDIALQLRLGVLEKLKKDNQFLFI